MDVPVLLNQDVVEDVVGHAVRRVRLHNGGIGQGLVVGQLQPVVQKYVVESNDGLLARLPVPFRVNCVLYKDYPAENLIPYLDRFKKVPGASIQFRFDYTATTPENLYEEEGDKILQDLKKIARYTGLDGCRMRCGFHFDYHGLELTYLGGEPLQRGIPGDGRVPSPGSHGWPHAPRASSRAAGSTAFP